MKKIVKMNRFTLTSIALFTVSLTMNANCPSFPDGGNNDDEKIGEEWNKKTKSPRNYRLFVNYDNMFIQISNLHSSTPITILIKDETGSIVYEQFIAPETAEVTIPIMDFPTGNYHLEVFSDSMDYVVWPIIIY